MFLTHRFRGELHTCKDGKFATILIDQHKSFVILQSESLPRKLKWHFLEFIYLMWIFKRIALINTSKDKFMVEFGSFV
jgi:hypothetical protein